MTSMKRRSDHRYDGETKGRTKNCDECSFKVDFHDKEICGWGKHFQYLAKVEKPRKCEYFGKEPPTKNSLNYVIFAKNNNLFGKSRNYKNQARQLSFAFYR